METNENDSPRITFERSIVDETTESEPPTVDLNPLSAYSTHSETTVSSIRGIQDGNPDVYIQQELNNVTEGHWNKVKRAKMYPYYGYIFKELPLSDAEFRRTLLYDNLRSFFDSTTSPNPPRSRYQKREADHKQESELENALSNGREVRIFEIPCQLAEHSTNALGDYGARKKFMREEYALRLGLPIRRNSTCEVTIGSGKQVTTVGTANIPFRFSGENEVHNLEFWLLSSCIHNVIIGKPFLKLTKTFSSVANFCRRVKERVVKGISQFHVLYLGASTPIFEGSINGRVQTALADSGSKVLLMDEAYARSIGVHIQTGHEHQTRLKFADNSVTDTAGMTYNVKWRFGRDDEFTSPYPLDFHILKNAPANIVLSDTFLFDTKAFSQYHQYLIDDDDDYEDEEMRMYFFAIDIDKRKKRMQVNITSFSLADLRYLELVRRGEQADRISTLPRTKGTAEQSIENERCAEWDRAFAAMQEKTQPQILQPFSAAVSHVQSTTYSHSSTSTLQGSRSSQPHRSLLKFSTWLKRGKPSTG